MYKQGVAIVGPAIICGTIPFIIDQLTIWNDPTLAIVVGIAAIIYVGWAWKVSNGTN
jgi:uncharacterized membrane protein YadS